MKTLKITGIDTFIIPNSAPTLKEYLKAVQDKRMYSILYAGGDIV